MEKQVRMKVLVFVDWYYPGYKAGGPIQSVRNLVATMRNFFSFYIITSNRDLHEDSPYSGISEETWVSGLAGENIFYIDPDRLDVKIIRRELASIQPDRIYINSMFSSSFSLKPLWAIYRKVPAKHIILAPRGMLHPGALGLKLAKKMVLLRLLRMLQVTSWLRFHATTEEELRYINHVFPTAEIIVAGNIPMFPPEKPTPVSKVPGILRLALVGRIHPTKNILFLLERLREQDSGSEIIVDVIGLLEDAAYFKICTKLVEQLPSGIIVRFRGALDPESLRSCLQEAHVMALPTLGENFGHAIFEALALGKPALISDRTPWRGMESSFAGWDIALENPEKFSQVIAFLAAMNQAEYDRWSEGAYQFAYNYFTNASYIQSYQALFA